MNIKNELIIGILGSVLIIFLTIFYFNQYQNQKQQFKNTSQNGATAQTSNMPLTIGEVAKHNSSGDCWIIIQNSVYNVTQYLNLHPGGSNRVVPFCGQDATSAFVTKDGQGSHSAQADRDLSQLKLGQLNTIIDIVNTSNQIQSNINSINSSVRSKYNDD